MLSPQLRKKVHDLWSLFWTAGIANPLNAIEQITYLLFIRQLENLDRDRVAKGKTSIYYSTRVSPEKERELIEGWGKSSHGPTAEGVKLALGVDYSVCRWSNIKQNPSFELLNGTVFPWLRGLEEWLKANSVSLNFTAESFKDIDAFIHQLERFDDSLSRTLVGRLSAETKNVMWKQPSKPLPESVRTRFINDLNAMIKGETLYHPDRFDPAKLRPETKQLAEKNPRGDELVHLNMILLEDAYPQFILPRRPNDDRLRQVTGRLSDAYFILDTNKTDTLTRAITLIDELFRHLDTRSVNADIMGDIFEYLLEEVKESGKNGQFRTPRHVIRFMVELLNPPLGSQILDPACGTGGFLLNTILQWKAHHTDKDVLKLEWDGTPHNTDKRVWPKGKSIDLNASFHGYDNDRTMVRIAWMNLILHGLEFPSVTQLDSLSKQLDKLQAEGKAAREYDHILANPPFTGNVDESDLSTNRQRFPPGKGGAAITNKSELLFVWLILDLLKMGGRAAVIVPDGVLFGNTNAHRELRRQLLFNNTLEAVVSLPGNVFQPYSGVKTSILVFQRAQSSDSKVSAGEPPRTQEVWFYEIEDEAYSLDQRRKERYGQQNDLWDALAKFHAWKRFLDGQVESSPAKKLAALREAATSPTYWQPEYWEERWVNVDDEFLKIFPQKKADKGHTFALHELWSELKFNPKDSRGARQLDEQITAAQKPKVETVFEKFCNQAACAAAEPLSENPDRATMSKAAEKAARNLVTRINKLIRDEHLLDREFDQFGLNALRPVLDEARSKAASWAEAIPFPLQVAAVAEPSMDHALQQLRPVLREFAKLDGYNVWRRSISVTEHPGKLRTNSEGKDERQPALQSWIVPTRVWARLESWGEDPETKQEIAEATHKGNDVRADYLVWLRDKLRIYENDGTVKEEHLRRLDSECLEALDFNLSAGRHKPFTFDAGEHRPPAELISELDAVHAEIRQRLEKLLHLVEGRA
jgi:type I restriction enzyme M protein